ncbi:MULTISPECIES: transposase family protein [unclassified Streptomyces]|uniref:transposase family protein n=1 Tax=unclassified Streptomyces TaxID=2593676 RepID=UPI002251D144|nr:MULTISPECIES: transposase family protein [unclassified Streptomyces]WSP53052.1 transposase family protein [Streptomyces sp. NBC_01241]WSU19649.1 transposase family protein [Streptomyces sp. NBC_01108]MCX4800063.1 transposase family protein [Streptomyces sp. NBC_01242]WSJ40749.1 transposase family protein [Streptomyces sp. NBC_01321]WSP59799.1 transposase family protein [Streptomyces sp. NBC_01241]
MASAAAAVLTGAKSLAAIGEWLQDAPAWALRVLGFWPDPLTGAVPVPHPATVRRLLSRLDGDGFDQAVGAFLAARTATAEGERQAIAVDGKTLRGSRIRQRPAVALRSEPGSLPALRCQPIRRGPGTAEPEPVLFEVPRKN